MEERRTKCLCYNCDDLYKPGHICKTQQLFMLVAGDEEHHTITVEEREYEELVQHSLSTSIMEISLHALTGDVTQDTIRIPGHINKHKIMVLVDTGSTHSFLDASLDSRLHIQRIGHMVVTAGEGRGLRGFRDEALPEAPSSSQTSNEDDDDFLKAGRKQTEERLEKALSRVKSMVLYPEARDQCRRLLTVVTEIQESKAMNDWDQNTAVEPVSSGYDDLIDLEALLEDDTFMTTLQ